MNSREVCLGVIDGRHEGEKLELIYREDDSGPLEAGRANVTLRTLGRVARALEVPFEDLLRFPRPRGGRARR